MDGQACYPIEVLLVEDNPADVRLMQEALKDSKVYNNLHVINDGENAMSFLRRKGKYAGVPEPHLILLDLNLPGKDGREVLDEIKNDPALKHLPVVIVTTSAAEEDILKSYCNHANCYVTKPVNLDQFIKVVQAIEDFWFTIVKLPRKK
ncbi:MAG: response regulator [Nitrospiraceae bacterium]|nr:MAG: response regulator [Nitrospiraceae bacterium]